MVFVFESVCVHSGSIKTLLDLVGCHSLSPLQVARGNVSLACLLLLAEHVRPDP